MFNLYLVQVVDRFGWKQEVYVNENDEVSIYSACGTGINGVEWKDLDRCVTWARKRQDLTDVQVILLPVGSENGPL